MGPMHMTATTWAILAMFIIGLLFTMTHTSRSVQEAFQGRPGPNSSNKDRCPNILIQKGSELQNGLNSKIEALHVRKKDKMLGIGLQICESKSGVGIKSLLGFGFA